MHAFADESRRGDYLVCAVTIAPSDLDSARKTLKSLRAPRSARIHMSHDSRRASQIIRGVVALDLQAHLYVVDLGGRSERHARDRALAAMATDLDTLHVRQLWLESCDQDRRDREVIRTALATSPGIRLRVSAYLPYQRTDAVGARRARLGMGQRWTPP